MLYCQSSSKSFRFYVEVIGKTAFFVRRERSLKAVIEDIRGYGHTYPETYTTWDSSVEGSGSHQRLCTYTLGSLKCLVRATSDGYLQDEHLPPSAAEDDSFDTDNVSGSTPMQAQSKALTVYSDHSEPSTSLQMHHAGTFIPQNRIFELKTRSTFTPFSLESVYPRCYLTLVSKLILAQHRNGSFAPPEITDLKAPIAAWELDNQPLLGRSHGVIKRIVKLAKSNLGRESRWCVLEMGR